MSEIQTLLADYLNYLEIEKNRSIKTRENYERYLRVFLAFAKISRPKQITDKTIRDFRMHLARTSAGSTSPRTYKIGEGASSPYKNKEQTLKKITQNYYVIALRNFLKYLTKRDIKVFSPEKIELPRVPRPQIEVVEYKDLEQLLTSPKGDGLRALRDRAILEVFFSTGLRLAELCALERYLDLTRGEITVRGKGDKLRVVFLSDRARAAIKKYLDSRGDTDSALFVSLTKTGKVLGRISPRAVERLVEHAARSAGIPRRIHPHEIRHSFATDLLINGADLRGVQELLGHANISTTQIYTHLTNKELREIHKSFHARRRK